MHFCELGMYTPPNTSLPSSLHKVESNSRLTININQVNLPSVPSLIPPSVSMEKQLGGEQETQLLNTLSNFVPPPPIPLPSQISTPYSVSCYLTTFIVLVSLSDCKFWRYIDPSKQVTLPIRSSSRIYTEACTGTISFRS